MKIAGLTTWHHDPLTLSSQIKTNAHNYDKFVVYGQMEYDVFRTGGYLNLIEAAESQNKKLIALAGASEFLNPVPYQDRVIYEFNPGYSFLWSFNSFYRHYDAMLSYVQGYSTAKFKYPFITMNRAAYAHRCEMIDLVYKNNLFEKNIVTWHKPEPLEPYTFKYWTPTKLILDPTFYGHQSAAFTIPKEYFECFAGLISESTEKAHFVTEKTVIPLFLRKPFLVAAASGYHKNLTTLGFKLYDEIFDYSFDDILDRTERYDTMLQNFVKLNKYNPSELNDLYQSILNKLEFNRQRACEIVRNGLFLSPTLKETIEIQKQTNQFVDWHSFEEMKLYAISEESFKKIHT